MGRARHVIWPNQKSCILVIVIYNEPILSSMLAYGIVQDNKLEKASEGGEVETTGGYFYLVSGTQTFSGGKERSGH